MTTYTHGDTATCCGCGETITYKTDRANPYWEHPNRYPYCKHPKCRHDNLHNTGVPGGRTGPGRPKQAAHA